MDFSWVLAQSLMCLADSMLVLSNFLKVLIQATKTPTFIYKTHLYAIDALHNSHG